jgi:hypothetical protein
LLVYLTERDADRFEGEKDAPPRVVQGAVRGLIIAAFRTTTTPQIVQFLTCPVQKLELTDN